MVRLLVGLLGACASLHARPARAVRLRRDGGNRTVTFLRIQKTGGSTWGEVIMPKICAEAGDIYRPRICAGAVDSCDNGFHWDYEMAMNANATSPGPVVTWLRDPVERTLSEFFFIRSPEGSITPFMDQWDFQNLTFLRLVRDEADDDKALDIYLHAWPQHPGFNRQVLYLAGFKGSGHAVRFRWRGGEQQQKEFLSAAKQHLADIQAFGFTECYVTSAAAMARVLGWDEASVKEMATNTHRRSLPRPTAAAGLRRHRGNAQDCSTGINRFCGVWRSFVDERTVEEIERLNWADMELHRFARRQFQLRFGQACMES
eukprot:CAMPEP_0171177666 /NCGR_PEP_ID=MMETSP0790-20130122/12355_1 /TAXON_ID=2925 /ORGANISM="Alexandrium catenella, Strain OF101" /LENGTH=315 /DNA_ID=CAMNT_0011642567 /DNA_START=72 /DNA_END=1022 /DNA_ORIENTATION=-